MKKIICLLCIFTLMFSALPVSAATDKGVGGWNEYRGRKYEWNELTELRETLLEDGYIQLTEENGYLNLLEDKAYRRYISIPGENVDVFVNYDDYLNYKNASKDKKDEARRLLWLNQVEIHSYGYEPIDETVYFGTLRIILHVAQEYKGNDIAVVLYNAEKDEAYQITVHEYNDYTFTDNIPTGTYTVSSLKLGKGIYNDIPLYCSESLTTTGFTVTENGAVQLNLGAGEDINRKLDIYNVTGHSDIDPEEPTCTPTPEPTAEPTPTPEPENVIIEENHTDRTIVILCCVGLAALAVLFFIIYRKWKEAQKQF